MDADVHRVWSRVGPQGAKPRGQECIEPLHHALLRPLAVGHPHRVPAGDTGPAPGSDIGGRPSVGDEKPSFRKSY